MMQHLIRMVSSKRSHLSRLIQADPNGLILVENARSSKVSKVPRSLIERFCYTYMYARIRIERGIPWWRHIFCNFWSSPPRQSLRKFLEINVQKVCYTSGISVELYTPFCFNHVSITLHTGRICVNSFSDGKWSHFVCLFSCNTMTKQPMS